jgi:hypothetical protein
VFVSKRRLVLHHCFVLFVLFGDCFLFILVVWLYVMIVDRREWSVRRIWRSRCARVWAAEFCWRQVFLDTCRLVLHNMHLSSLYLLFLLALTFGNLLRIMPSLLLPLPCNRVNQNNLEGTNGLECLTGMVLINLDTFTFYVPLYVTSLQDHFVMIIGIWRTTQENNTTTRTNGQWSWLNN